ncbi:MAG: GNAT family N-acetyltransferase [Bacteroidaceae bacterium]|nr:GNAT family N-acetyltransferase [Bacteroidaceae bacterium]
MTYQYLSQSDIYTAEYRAFLEDYHGEGSYEQRRERMEWYWQPGDDGFRVLTAKQGKDYVGQACAYRVEACINQQPHELWWGVDSFVLSSMRGQGIGKALQGQLHRDLPNFSSAWYSPTNGAIKRKCGARPIMTFPFAYYPTSCYFSILLELMLKKAISNKITLPHLRLPHLYTRLNTLTHKSDRSYIIAELSIEELPSLAPFIQACLAGEPFHIIRSEQYLRWKYIASPQTRCRALTISKNKSLVGLVVFSQASNNLFVASTVRTVKIYESVFTKDSGLTHRHLLLAVANYLKQHHEKIDGIQSLQNIKYRPTLVYPFSGTELLSTINVGKLSSGYITLIDQDMEH